MRRDDKLIQRFLDGECTGESSQRVRARLASEPRLARHVASALKLREALREHAQHVVAVQDFDGFYARVEQGIQRARPPSLWKRFVFLVQQWFRPWQLWPATGAALAAAALLVLGLGHREGPNECLIESIEYGGKAAAIFIIPDEDAKGSTTAVWVTEETDDE